jgi:CO/xanthine dehydrogenase FAD-binding subunit
VTTLIDITQFGWSEIAIAPDGLTIGATCIMSDLLAQDYPAHWPGVRVLKQAVHELASFKVQNIATIGGNLCLAIPAGTFAPAMVLLDAEYEIVSLNGESYWVPAAEFQTGIRQTILEPGQLLRQIKIPKDYLEWQVSYHRICEATAGLAIAIALTAYDPARDRVRCVVSAAMPVPQLVEFDHIPTETELAEALEVQMPACLDDTLASAAYRRHVAHVLMVRSLQEATSSATA